MAQMKYLLITLLLIVAPIQAKDYTYLEISQGIKIHNMPWGNSNWNGECPTAISFGRHWLIDKSTYFRAQLNHTSNICKGVPFRKAEDETWLDQANITIGVKF